MKKRKSRSGQLVCQHLENISREALEDYQDIVKDYVRGRHGVYALYRGKRLYYVGLASRLHLRLKQHLKDHHAQSWDRFSVYLTVGEQNLKEMETLLLRITKPSGNKMLGNFSRSENLRQGFRHDISERQKAVLVGLLGGSKDDKKPGKKPPKKKGTKSRLADYVKKPLKIRFKYKGKTYRASIRKNGTISYKGKIFKSPSRAAEEVTGGSMDGWFCWRYERAPGDWVPLDELRKR